MLFISLITLIGVILLCYSSTLYEQAIDFTGYEWAERCEKSGRVIAGIGIVLFLIKIFIW